MLLPLWLGAAPMPAVSASEEALLASGAPIVRVLNDDGAQRTGVIDVSAPPDEVFASVLDLRGRAQAGSEITITSRTATAMTATIEVDYLAYEATVHVVYEIDAAARVCHFALDPQKSSDIARLEGDFVVVPQGAGSRVYYWGVSDFPGYFPDRLKRWFAEEGVEDVLVKIQRLSEA